jgi:hypothetical protein
MSQSTQRSVSPDAEPVRVLGRGLRASRGVRLTLRTIREATGRTQVAVAQESQMDQGDISRLEGRSGFDDCQVATLQRYVAALGGKLELVATFGDKRITIVGIETASVATMPANSRPETDSKRKVKARMRSTPRV